MSEREVSGPEGTEAVIRNKRILVTGGTGSFGNQIIAKLGPLEPMEIRVLSRDEDKQYRQRLELAHFGWPLSYKLGDVRDAETVRSAIRGIDIVLHAAALKHVPSSEREVWQVVQTNVVGAHHVITAAVAEQVEAVVAISTDKAVEPINAMGMSKALQEKLIVSAHNDYGRGRVRFACVRYGNVVGSRGSVIPLFHQLIASGQALTLTDPAMTRFMLTLPNAVDLVLQALCEAEGGELFVKDSPSSTVLEIAEGMLASHHSEPGWTVVGRRPGEKPHETLVSEAESRRAFRNGDVIAVLPETQDPEASRIGRDWHALEVGARTSFGARRLSSEELLAMLASTGWSRGRS